MPTVHDRRAAAPALATSLRTVIVDDPYEIGGKIFAIASMRDDPLARLHARGQIDDAQYAAGRHWQKLFGDSEVGGLKAMDTTKEPVDGGGFSDPITDRQRRAVAGLIRATKALGLEGEALVRDILGRRWFIEQAAAARGLHTQRGIDYLGRRFRECLETIAKEFGYA